MYHIRFLPFREARNALVKPVGMKNVPAASKDLVPIRLMANVPNKLIVRRIKNVVQRNVSSTTPRLAPKMTAIDGDVVNN